jgi:hypothetical protein
MANNKKRIRKLSQYKSKHFFRNGLLVSYKFTVHILSVQCFFIGNVDRMVNLHMECKYGHSCARNIKHNPNSIFLAPVTEEEVSNVTSKLKGKLSAGYDEIPEKTVKQEYSVY